MSLRRLFRKEKQERRILRQIERTGDRLEPEYHRPTPECPHPERWRMFDSMTAEVEVLEFLRTIVTTIKPELVVETGTFSGISTLWIAEGLKANGRGRVITCEFDDQIYENAKARIQASGLAEWIELRNESSLEMKVEGTIDLFFSDSDMPIREQEIRRFPVLYERRKQRAGTLSGGEQQMLAISRGLMSRPKMLLMDEPSMGLAPLLVRQVAQTILDLNAQGVTVLLVEQLASMALAVADRAYVIQNGVARLQGRSRDVAANPEVVRLYLGGAASASA